MENTFRLTSSSVSDRGLSDKRPVNEDSFTELRELGLFAVADGVGGAQAGDVASQMAMEIIGEAFQNRRENTDAEDIMRLAIESANKAIHQMSEEIPQLSTMATTIAAVHLNDNIATVAHVGDSRVYRILPDGRLRRETDDHSVVEEEVRAGRMTPAQAATHPSRNVISRALGADSTVDVELKTIMIEPGTMFLLCSDGVTRHISDGELEELFNHEVEPDVLVQQMREVCYSRGAEDNLTAVVIRVSGAVDFEPARGETRDVEEDTIATVRMALSDSSWTPFQEKLPENLPSEFDAPSEDQSTSEDVGNDDIYDITTHADEYKTEPPASHYSDTREVPEDSVKKQVSQPYPIDERRGTSIFDTDEPVQRSGAISRMFSSLLLLLIGASIGIGGFYVWQLQTAEPTNIPVLNESQSSTIPLSVTTFEQLRREVDRDPNRYLLAKAASPQDAEDHYLLGRAQLLTGKYFEAARQFALAKERLAGTDPANASTLKNEIALGEAITSNPAVQEAFVRQVVDSLQAQPNGNLANSASNSNSPVR